MANNFLVWIDDNKLDGSILQPNVFNTDSQRQEGFKAGTAASAIRVNTILRSTSLVTAALMKALELNESLSYTTNYDTLSFAIKDRLQNIFDHKVLASAKVTCTSTSTYDSIELYVSFITNIDEVRKPELDKSVLIKDIFFGEGRVHTIRNYYGIYTYRWFDPETMIRSIILSIDSSKSSTSSTTFNLTVTAFDKINTTDQSYTKTLTISNDDVTIEMLYYQDIFMERT